MTRAVHTCRALRLIWLIAGLMALCIEGPQQALAQGRPAEPSQPVIYWPFGMFGTPSPPPPAPVEAPPTRTTPRPRPAPNPSQAARPPQVARIPAKPEPVVPEGPPPVYERDLLRLAEVLGALSVLRDICGNGEGSEVRAGMQALLDAEAQTQPRRERLAGAYNRYARAYALTHRACTDSSKLAMQRFLTDGTTLARAISSRFGG